MKILSFDTSTRALSLAVADHGKVLRHRNLRQMKFLSSSIMPGIQSFLKSAGLTLNDVEGIIVGLGPGSFTSLRVGMATAKALAFARNIPVFGVASMDAIAMSVKDDGKILVMNDARRGLVYACSYEKKGAVLRRLSDYVLEKPEQVVKNFGDDAMVMGDAVPLYRPLLKPFAHVIDDSKYFHPDARHLVSLGYEALRRLPPGSDHPWNPIYLYPEDCQVHKKTSV